MASRLRLNLLLAIDYVAGCVASWGNSGSIIGDESEVPIESDAQVKCRSGRLICYGNDVVLDVRDGGIANLASSCCRR
jgi:hypothetical protein